MSVPRGNAWFWDSQQGRTSHDFRKYRKHRFVDYRPRRRSPRNQWARERDFVPRCRAVATISTAMRWYVNVTEYDSKAFEDCKFEAHKRYIDSRVVASGIERIDSQVIAKCEAGEFDERGRLHAARGRGRYPGDS